MKALTFSRISGRTCGWSLTTLDTVLIDTPAASATSRNVVGRGVARDGTGGEGTAALCHRLS
ncbi:hypothetical protein GCM10027519_36220 [Kineococcus endophyticus]